MKLARRHQPEWVDLSDGELLRELELAANPGHLCERDMAGVVGRQTIT